MNKIFVFCIGGSGLRVLKSLVMLLASGLDVKGYDIVPILIDPHKDLDELKNVNALLSCYSRINKNINICDKNNDNKLDGFFSTNIVSLDELGEGNGDVTFDFDRRNDNSFKEVINLNALNANDVNRQLIELLYSEVNLEKSLSVGFKGSPNVGCVILNETIENAAWWSAFESRFKSGDKIFIMSSIFGGTGASGFPLLVKKIETSSNSNVKKAVIGALSVLPYFDLTNPDTNSENKEIDSKSFASKTKSALSYYEKVLNIDYLYYIGDKSDVQYVNDEIKQHNDAHIVELVGATALLHFAAKEKTSEPQYPGIGIEKDATVLDWDSIGVGHKYYMRTLSNLLSFYHIIKILPKEKDFPLSRTLDMNDSQLFNTEAFRDLECFMDEYFYPWINELNRNKRAFAPFNLNIDVETKSRFKTLVKGKEYKKRFLIGKPSLGISHYLYEMMNVANKMKSKEREYKNPFRHLIYCVSGATQIINNEMLK